MRGWDPVRFRVICWSTVKVPELRRERAAAKVSSWRVPVP
jgi:hypothetical protein